MSKRIQIEWEMLEILKDKSNTWWNVSVGVCWTHLSKLRSRSIEDAPDAEVVMPS